MSPIHRSASHLWDIARRKFFPKRSSNGSSSHQPTTIDSWASANTDLSPDGFYAYSQTELDREARQMETLQQQASDSTEASYESAIAEPERPSVPYTISSPEWNSFSPSVRYLDIRGDKVDEWFHSVLGVYTKVYTASKIFAVTLMYYGVDLDTGVDGMWTHLKKAEVLATSDSICVLIDTIEGLYYAVYSRILMEIANVELCANFSSALKPSSPQYTYNLPEPEYLQKIFLFLKQGLDSPSVCVNLNTELIKSHQDGFITRLNEYYENSPFLMDDLLGYRRFTRELLYKPSSAFNKKWAILGPAMTYQMPPREILIRLSEKYLSITPKPEPILDEIPASALPFRSRETMDAERWEREIILDHRQATLAKLEGKCLGDVRREDDRRLLMDYAKERKCTCRSACFCAWDCTLDPERPCPCAERVMRVMLVKHRKSVGSRPVGVRCGTLANAVFQSIACLRRDIDDYEIGVEIDRSLLLFAEEIQRQRLSAPVTVA